MNKKKNALRTGFWCMMFTSACLLCGCVENSADTMQTNEPVQEEKNYSVLLPGTYDSKDTAVLLSKNEEEKTLTFFNLEKGRKYTLNYDGTTNFYDKYEEALALSQVDTGSIVDVTFLKGNKKLNTLQLSKSAWSNTQVSRFEINELRKNMSIGSDVYKISGDLVVMQESGQMELMDINAMDVLTVRGIGTSVYSVEIEKGHGYLRLTGDEYFIGGWIEVGQSLIQEITEGMLLTVPEGTYDVAVSHGRYSGVKQVTIERNQEVELDLSDLQGEEVKTGTILFSINVPDAKVFVDGVEVNISAPVVLEYGIHQLMAKAEGYKTSTSYLKVSQESAGINIVLDKLQEQDREDTVSDSDLPLEEDKMPGKDSPDNTVSDNHSGTDKEEPASGEDKEDTVSGSDKPATSGYYKIFIDNPSDTEVYFDGNYVGISPVGFKKTSGTHVITLRKKGYETRSYTICVDEEKRDVSYSFVELEQEK